MVASAQRPTQSHSVECHPPAPLGQPTDSFAPNPCRYATIGALLGEKAAVPFAPFAPYHASAARTAPAASPPPAPQWNTKAIFRPALLHAAAAEHRESLRTEGYAVVGKVYEPGVLGVLREHYRDLVGSGVLSFSDPQSSRYVVRNEKVGRLLHEDLTPIVSLIAGRRVEPTYTYFSGYVHGSELPLHTDLDRDDCEYILSFLIERQPAKVSWPIVLEKRVTPGLRPGPKHHAVHAEDRIELDHEGENSFVIFKGRHHAHFREGFRGNYSYILLLHYVHSPKEQPLMRNGDERSARGADVPAQLAALAEGERIVRADGGPLPNAVKKGELEHGTEAEFVLVPKSEHFFYPGRAIGHLQQLASPPLTLQTVSLSPRVFRVDNFLSEDECLHIMRVATPALQPSILQSRGHPQQVKGGIVNPIRTSETAWLDRFFGVNRGAPEDKVTRAAVLRAVALARVPGDTHAEGLQVLRYRTNGGYRHHVDWLEGHHPARLATVLIYLNDAETPEEPFGRLRGGGGTNFAQRHSQDYDEMRDAGCRAGTTIAPRAGAAVFFYNMHPERSATKDYAMDWRSWHSGCNVTAGVKWVAKLQRVDSQ